VSEENCNTFTFGISLQLLPTVGKRGDERPLSYPKILLIHLKVHPKPDGVLQHTLPEKLRRYIVLGIVLALRIVGGGLHRREVVIVGFKSH